MNSSGIILLNKRPGYTSFVEIQELKKRFGLKKVGHAGTLDKFASGLLIVLSGYMTKLNPYFSQASKTYITVFKFGEETDTLDPHGSIIKQNSVPDEASIKNSLKHFTGEIYQKPPIYSAIHVKGQRAYKSALKGEYVDIPERKILIHNISILSWKPPYLKLSISCSKGTYIRSIARDLGADSGSCAYVTELKRTRIGDFLLDSAYTVDNFTPDMGIIKNKNAFQYLEDCKFFTVKNEYTEKVLNGNAPKENWIKEMRDQENFKHNFLCFFDENEKFLCMYTYNSSNNSIKSIYVNSQFEF